MLDYEISVCILPQLAGIASTVFTNSTIIATLTISTTFIRFRNLNTPNRTINLLDLLRLTRLQCTPVSRSCSKSAQFSLPSGLSAALSCSLSLARLFSARRISSIKSNTGGKYYYGLTGYPASVERSTRLSRRR